jgi:hypothetical protein
MRDDRIRKQKRIERPKLKKGRRLSRNSEEKLQSLITGTVPGSHCLEDQKSQTPKPREL